MPSHFINESDHWRARAEEARILASQINDSVSKDAMLCIAEGYERLAKRSLLSIRKIAASARKLPASARELLFGPHHHPREDNGCSGDGRSEEGCRRLDGIAPIHDHPDYGRNPNDQGGQNSERCSHRHERYMHKREMSPQIIPLKACTDLQESAKILATETIRV
jgi:hypothetical protein